MEKRDRQRVAELADELLTVRLDRSASWSSLLERFQELAELDTVGLYAVRNRTGSWEIERWEGTGVMLDAKRLVRRLLERASTFPLYYDPMRPPVEQRNKVIDALAWIDSSAPGSWERSTMYNDVLNPLRIGRHRQPRVLLCDGPSLLGWFGGMAARPVTRRQFQLISAVAAPLRKRLMSERRLLDASLVTSALEHMLDRTGAPTFLLDANGRIQEANASGRKLLAELRGTLTAALRDAIRGRAQQSTFDLTSLRDRDGSTFYIAIQRASTIDERIATCVETCTRRWGLTPRQAEVLEHVVRGRSNATIAATLECVERTVELHVTALFDRANVDSRAALVAAVLTIS